MFLLIIKNIGYNNAVYNIIIYLWQITYLCYNRKKYDNIQKMEDP